MSSADREALGSIFSDPDKFYAAAPYTFLFASLLILFFGPGKFSLDTLIVWYRKKCAAKIGSGRQVERDSPGRDHKVTIHAT